MHRSACGTCDQENPDFLAVVHIQRTEEVDSNFGERTTRLGAKNRQLPVYRVVLCSGVSSTPHAGVDDLLDAPSVDHVLCRELG